jgi:hypothetical protein
VKGRAARVRRLFPKLTWLILDLFCPITRLQLLGLRHRRYTAHQLGSSRSEVYNMVWKRVAEGPLHAGL